MNSLPIAIRDNGNPLNARQHAALQAARQTGFIQPPDGVNWFSADLNQLVVRNLISLHRLREDNRPIYKLQGGR